MKGEDLKVFKLFLEIAGISKERIEFHAKNFENSNVTMEEYSQKMVVEECETLFLKRILMRFSKVYDDPFLRKRIQGAIEKGIPPAIKGDFHVHTNWSDGTYDLESYVKKAEELGYKYISVSDHSLVNKGTVQMDERKFLKQMEYVDELQKNTPLRIFKSVEIDVNEDGTLDYPTEILEKADFVLGAVHFDYSKGKEKAFELLKVLIQNEVVKIIAHPLNKMGGDFFKAHLEEVVQLVKENKKVLEISLVPDRIRESDFLVENLKGRGVKFSFGSDSHSVKQLELMALSNLWINELNTNDIANFYEEPLEFFER